MKRIALLLMVLILALGFMNCCLELEPELKTVPVFDFDTYTSKLISTKSIVIERDSLEDFGFILFAPMFNGLTEDFIEDDSYTTNVRGNKETLSVQTSGSATTFEADYGNDGSFSVTIDEVSGNLNLFEEFVFKYILHDPNSPDPLTGTIYKKLDADFVNLDLENYNVSTVIKLYIKHDGSGEQIMAASVQLYKDDNYFGILIKAVRSKMGTWSSSLPNIIEGMPEPINLDEMENGDLEEDGVLNKNVYSSYVYKFDTGELHIDDEFDLDDDDDPVLWTNLWKSIIISLPLP